MDGLNNTNLFSHISRCFSPCLADGHLLPLSSRSFSVPVLISSYKDTIHNELVLPTPLIWPNFTFAASLKALCPITVTFWGSEVRNSMRILGEHFSVHNTHIFPMALALVQECHFYCPKPVWLSLEKLCSTTTDILKQSPSLQNPSLLSVVNFSIPSFKTPSITQISVFKFIFLWFQ